MITKLEKDRGRIPYQALLDRNRALEGEIQDLKIRLEESEELRRAISEGDLDALIIRGPEEELVFTLDSADRAYRVLVETMNEGTATLAADGTILYCNRQFAELTKMLSTTVVGTSIYGFIAPEDATTFKALLKQKTSAGELKFRDRDGMSIPVYLSISSLQSEGSPNAWCVVATNLTEQKKNEEIVAAERLARSIIEQAAEAIVVCDITGRITHFSNAVPRVCKCNPTFKKFEDIMDVRFSEGEDKRKSISPVSSALKGDTIIGMEAILEVEDCQDFHQKLHLLLNSGPLKNENGRIIGCVVTLTDITESKLAEEALRKSEYQQQELTRSIEVERARLASVLENLPVGVWIADESGQLIGKNTEADRIWAGNAPLLKSIEEYPQYTAWYADSGKLLVSEEYPVAKALLTGHPVEPVELNILRFDDTEGTVLVSASPIKDRQGRLTGVVGINLDITERKKTEDALHQAYEEIQIQSRELQAQSEKLKEANEALSESEALYRGISQNFPEGAVYIFDRDLRFRVADGKALETLGYTRESLESRTIWEATDEETCRILEERYLRVLEGESLHFETKLKDHIFSSAYVPIRDEHGIIIAGMVVSHDITKLKRAEEALRESEEKYRNIIETANEGIWIVDPEARTTYVNKRMAEMLRCTQEEMIGKLARLFTDKESTAISQRNMERRRKGINESHELKLTRKDGSSLWTLINAKSLFDKNGKFVGSMSMLTDITERKKAEDKLKETLDNLENLVKERTVELEKAYNSLKESERGLAEAQKMAHLGSWYRNLITGKIYWSDEIYRIFGFKPQEFEVTFDTFLNYVHPEDRGYVENNLKKALNGEPYSTDYRVITANGTERIIHSQGEVIIDEKNAPTGIRGTIQDITERKMAEEALEKIDKIRIKEIHHRIKNNLQVICSLLSLEAERFNDEKILEAFKESQNRVASMALIHEELYRGNKSDTLDFAAYLHKFTKDLFGSYNLGGSNINLKTNLEQVYLDMDTAVPLGIIVNELISNSLKHAFPTGSEGEILISLLRTGACDIREDISDPNQGCREKGNFQYILRVMDNGKGIPEEIEIENADSLGLQLVNILVDQLDGCIRLRRDCGTDFTILFGNNEP